MFFVKIIDGLRQEKYECGHYAVTRIPDTEVAAECLDEEPGIVIELMPSEEMRRAGDRPIVLRLPADGTEVYIENHQGDTVDSYRCPPTTETRQTDKEIQP